MIRAAERLFAERGVNGVSLREIGAAAGQRNNSAAQYHFGSKAGLLDAVFAARMSGIDARRRAMLDELEASGRHREIRALVETIVYPLVEALDLQAGASWYARFLVQTIFTPGFRLFDAGRADVTQALQRVLQHLDRCCAHVPAPIRAHRIALGTTMVVHALADRERVLDAGSVPVLESAALFAAELVDAVVGVLEAPVSTSTKQELRAAKRASA